MRLKKGISLLVALAMVFTVVSLVPMSASADTYAIGDAVAYGGQAYTVQSDNLITNGFFTNGTTGWTNRVGTAIAGYTVETGTGPGGINVLVGTGSGGARSTTSIGMSWTVEVGKMYYVSWYWGGTAPTSNNYQYNKMYGACPEYLASATRWVGGSYTKNEFVFTATTTALQFMGSWTNSGSRYAGFELYEVAVATSAPITIEYREAGANTAFLTLDATGAIGSPYKYTAPETYTDETSIYQLQAQPASINVTGTDDTVIVYYYKTASIIATNLMENGSFTDALTTQTALGDGNGWLTKTGASSYAVPAEASRVTTFGRTDNYSISPTINGGGTSENGNLIGVFNLKPDGTAPAAGTKYRFSFWRYSDTNTTITLTVGLTNPATDNAQVVVSCGGLDNDGNSGGPSCNLSGLPTGEWTQMSYILTADGTVTAAQFYPRWAGASATFFDDLEIYEYEDVTTPVEINYYDSTDSTNIVRLSGASAITLEGYVSGAAGSADVPILTEYAVEQPSPIVVGGVTYIADTAQTNVTNIASVSPEGGNVINLYYKQAPIVYAEWNAGAVKTRVGVTPTIPTDGVADFWTGDPDVDPADGAANLVSYDEQALAAAVASAGSKTITGTILGYSDTIEIPIEVIASLDYLTAHYEFKDATTPVKDSSGNGYDGTVLNDEAEMSFDTENGFATFPGYQTASGLGAAITIPGEVASKMSGDWTYSVWANRDYTGDTVKQSSNMIVFDVATGNYTRYYFQFNSGTGNRVIRDRGAAANSGYVNATYDSPFPMKDKWSMMTVTFDSAT
ncbi:MAG: hypothetical protein Q4C12_08175, partial [Clostridia bacterium]|nr:hypothetical protein [Clostridia bacterium]